MINSVSKVKKLQAQSRIPNVINASLPVIIKVIEKTGYNRYHLKFGSKTVSTKSEPKLEVGEEYFANIRSQSGGVININGLIKRENIGEYLENGSELLEKILSNRNISWLIPYIKTKLANPKNENEFLIYSNMILALNDGVINVPFFYEKRSGLAQIKLGEEILFYLLFSNFAPIIASIKNGRILTVQSAYLSFSKTLGEALGCEYKKADIRPFWVKKSNFLDFKG
ncbi:hypothetical protein [Campylobacter fetus]|uniref:hypothetical protein n=1 Tax=Campylobacter fetus TaxID=196 RepID=UPI000FCA9C88|nr:hypothetical protein [Campylobacter fetus]QQF51560.1 hypothetical protein HHI31_01460 [Campylobacter fetus subsp. venerealis]RUT51129.1 hypothetical protein BWK67_01000 [Campylobacter fetus]RUT51856.1 hypothetical protein BWK51_01000 [Campylobacter fetus]